MEQIIVRSACLEDSPDLASLSEQLGYPTTAREVEARLPKYIDSDTARVVVAEHKGRVIAWTSIEIVDHFYLEKFAELSGFVVDSNFRGQGVGHELMREAERWAASKGLSVLRLKTNVVRTGAHKFYESMGFECVKTQYTYVKKLAPPR